MACWHYHRDEQGREWGPFSPGQCTALLNRGVLNQQSQMRLDGDAEWVPFGRRKVPKDSFNPSVPMTDEDRRRLADGDRLAMELELHVARTRVAPATAPYSRPDLSALIACVENASSLVLSDCRWSSPSGLCELVFASTGELKLSLFLILAEQWAPVERQPGDVPEAILNGIVGRRYTNEDVSATVQVLELDGQPWDLIRVEWKDATSKMPGPTIDDWFLPVKAPPVLPLIVFSVSKYLIPMYHVRVLPAVQAVHGAVTRICADHPGDGAEALLGPRPA